MTLLYEKKESKQTRNFQDYILWFAAAVLTSVYLLHLYTSFIDVVGTSAKATEIINAVAQIATTGVFIIGLKQYMNTRKEVKQNHRDIRQSHIGEEAKLQVAEMIKVCARVPKMEDVTIDDFNHYITRMSNLGTNFDTLFRAMDEDVNKAIVRMRWQDMYFNHLHAAIRKFDVRTLILSERGDPFTFDISDEWRQINKLNLPDTERDYQFSLLLLNTWGDRLELREKIHDIFLFKNYYLEINKLNIVNDLLLGTLEQVNIKWKCPKVAAIDEWLNKKYI